jgi:hypothetical protein
MPDVKKSTFPALQINHQIGITVRFYTLENKDLYQIITTS